ncbi:hypothetical protein EVAR_31310_1 [Eumeta japonica]|uniref:Uncharacterized protein n=1 Tax=Eumeta variegata TaxID=151549 RepID=A0A4C1VTP4_EUMVA|nr:hypothetical protein EVAR_31310_1 [Eumeta japonica]
MVRNTERDQDHNDRGIKISIKTVTIDENWNILISRLGAESRPTRIVIENKTGIGIGNGRLMGIIIIYRNREQTMPPGGRHPRSNELIIYDLTRDRERANKNDHVKSHFLSLLCPPDNTKTMKGFRGGFVSD